MAELNDLSMQEVGRRLKIARERLNIKQEDAANAIEVSRPTLVAIEQGSRRIKMKELQVLTNRYGTSVNALLRREAVYTDIIPQFRKVKDSEAGDSKFCVDVFGVLIRADVELQNLLGIESRRNYPPENGISEGKIDELAEKNAQRLRDYLNLSTGPIYDIFSLIENRLGIRLYQRCLPSKVDGLFYFDETVGACILLNARHPLERRVQSAAHELGHFDGTRRVAEILDENESFTTRDERYAQAFGRAFLTPESAFKEHFQELKRLCATDKLTPSLIVLLANRFAISREACVRRMEELGLTAKGSWDWYKLKKPITNKMADEILGETARREDPAKQDAERPLSRRLSLMTHAVWKRGLLSEGQLAELLQLDRIELRKIIDEIELEDEETDDFLKLSD